jgi:hypothetical protein
MLPDWSDQNMRARRITPGSRGDFEGAERPASMVVVFNIRIPFNQANRFIPPNETDTV